MNNAEHFKISNKIVLLMKEDNEQLRPVDNEDIKEMVSMLISDYLATISRGLARSKDKNNYIIVKNNVFNTELSPGLFFRIPINVQNREKFIQLLIEDLQNYTAGIKQLGQYSVLETINTDIIVRNIKKVIKNTDNNYVKATVFEPE